MPPLKDDAQRGGDALQDGGHALDDLEHGDPTSAAHDLADGARALGLGSVADAIDDALGLLDGPLPEMTYGLFFGKPTLTEDVAGMAEGVLGDAADQLGGGLLGSLAHTAVDRATKMLDDKIGGSSSGWTLVSFKLTEEFSRPWALQMTLQRPEIAAMPGPAAPAGGLIGEAEGFIQGLQSGGGPSPMEKAKTAAMGLAENLLGVSGLTSQADGSPAEQPPQTGVPLDPASFLNQPFSISFSRRNKDGKAAVERWITGVVSEFEDLGGTLIPQKGQNARGVQGGERFINVTVVPALWKLSLRRDCRIFQDMNAIAIVREVFETAGVYAGITHGSLSVLDALTDGVHLIPPDKVDRGDWTPTREMCVQYNETDLDFVHRLLEEEGITYFFDCQKRKERIVFFEDPMKVPTGKTVNGKPVPFARADEVRLKHPAPPSASTRWDDKPAAVAAQPEVFWRFTLKQRVQPKRVSLRDYNWRLMRMVTPAGGAYQAPPTATQMPYNQDVDSTTTEPNAARLYETGLGPLTTLATQYAYPHALTPPPDPEPRADGAYGDFKPYAAAPHDASDPAARLRDAYRAAEEIALGEGNVTTVRPGVVMELQGFLDYRSDVTGIQGGHAVLTPPSTGNALADKASWRQANDANDQLRSPRDDAFKKPTRLLITRVEHYGQQMGSVAYAAPKGIDVATVTTGQGTTTLSNAPQWANVTSTVLGFVSPTNAPLTSPSRTSIATQQATFGGAFAPPSPLVPYTPPGSSGDLSALSFYNRFECIVLDSHPNALNVYRPMPRTPKPRIRGLHTALVVNADHHFSDGLEHQLHVQFGHRVKVHFHWDRRGDSLIEKRKSSCWVPVATLWAGSSEASVRDWGTTFIPRAGMEVLVGFLEGDPDRPVVIGCVPNGHQPPATVPLPQPIVRREDPHGGQPQPLITDDPPLPATPPSLGDAVHPYRAVIKSQSEPFSANTGNWIVFDDNLKQEWVQLRAQNQLIKDVTNDYTVSVLDPAKPAASAWHTQVNAVKLDQLETIGKDAALTVSGDRTKTVKLVETNTVQGNHEQGVLTGDETIVIDRGRLEVVTGYDRAMVGPDTVDPNEDPNAPSRKLTVNRSQRVTIQKREAEPKDDGNDTLHVAKSKTDLIDGKLTLEAKSGLAIALEHPVATGIEAGPISSPPDPGRLSVKSETDIHLGSTGTVAIRSDHHDVQLEGDEHVSVSAQHGLLYLSLKSPNGEPDDVVIAGSPGTASGVKGIRIVVGGPDEKKTTLTMDDTGILVTIEGSQPDNGSSIEIKKDAAITLTGNTLRIGAQKTVTMHGAITFRPQ